MQLAKNALMTDVQKAMVNSLGTVSWKYYILKAIQSPYPNVGREEDHCLEDWHLPNLTGVQYFTYNFIGWRQYVRKEKENAHDNKCPSSVQQ